MYGSVMQRNYAVLASFDFYWNEVHHLAGVDMSADFRVSRSIVQRMRIKTLRLMQSKFWSKWPCQNVPQQPSQLSCPSVSSPLALFFSVQLENFYCERFNGSLAVVRCWINDPVYRWNGSFDSLAQGDAWLRSSNNAGWTRQAKPQLITRPP